MGESEEARNDMVQRLQSSFGTSSSSFPIPHLNTSEIRSQFKQFPQNFQQSFTLENNKRPGIPPSHPNIPPQSPQIPASRSPSQQPVMQNFTTKPSHSRSLSQPAFFSFDSLPPLSPSPYRDSPSAYISETLSVDVSMEDRNENLHTARPSPFTGGSSVRIDESLPPRKTHRRSVSDIPFGFSNSSQYSPSFVPLKSQGISATAKENLGGDKPISLVKRESEWDKDGDNAVEGMGERKSEAEVIDDLFSAYMNLDNMDTMNSSENDDKHSHENRDDLDSRASGTKTYAADSSDNEAESSINRSGTSIKRANLSSSGEKKEGTKRSAEHTTPSTRHYRSISMDSFMGEIHSLGDESPKLAPSPGTQRGQHSHNNSMDGTSATFSLDFGNGEFSGTELKKIMANEKLAEIALADPKRAKRILANRQSAARSKERKVRYISELEHKVQTLQTEATTLSAQLTMLQRDSSGLTTHNNELKFRLQAMEQQAHLRDALNEALTAEVQRLKLATGELSRDMFPSNCLPQQLSMHPQMFQQQQQQSPHLNMYQMQQQQQPPPPPQKDSAATKNESPQSNGGRRES